MALRLGLACAAVVLAYLIISLFDDPARADGGRPAPAGADLLGAVTDGLDRTVAALADPLAAGPRPQAPEQTASGTPPPSRPAAATSGPDSRVTARDLPDRLHPARVNPARVDADGVDAGRSDAGRVDSGPVRPGRANRSGAPTDPLPTDPVLLEPLPMVLESVAMVLKPLPAVVEPVVAVLEPLPVPAILEPVVAILEPVLCEVVPTALDELARLTGAAPVGGWLPASPASPSPAAVQPDEAAGGPATGPVAASEPATIPYAADVLAWPVTVHGTARPVASARPADVPPPAPGDNPAGTPPGAGGQQAVTGQAGIDRAPAAPAVGGAAGRAGSTLIEPANERVPAGLTPGVPTSPG
nr:hypothetical protein [Micromonospora sp. DSM 115978]